MGQEIGINGNNVELGPTGSAVAVATTNPPRFTTLSFLAALPASRPQERQRVTQYIRDRAAMAGVGAVYPLDGATGINAGVDLDIYWNGGLGTVAGHDFALSLNSNMSSPIAGEAATVAGQGHEKKTTIANANLTASTTHYWQITVTTLDGDTITSPIFSFDTA